MSEQQTAKLDELFRRLPEISKLDPRLVEDAKIELNVLKFRAGAQVQTHKQKSWSKTDVEQLQDQLKEKDTEILLLKRQLQNRNSLSRGNGEVNSRQVIKIRDNYKRLFEQEWSETYEYFKLQGWSEIEIIVTLQRILRATYSFCQDVAREQLENIEGEAMYPSAAWMDDDGILTRTKQRQISREIVELARLYQRTTAQECLSALQKTFIDHVLPTFIDPSRYSNKITKQYTKKCVDISWSMCIQDPPMTFLDKLDRGADFDHETFRKYTTTGGDKFDYLVWPAMLLHNGGELIVKGIAQPIKIVYDFDGDDDDDDEDELISNKSEIISRRTAESQTRHSRMSKSRGSVNDLEPEGQRIIPQTPPKVYKHAPSRDEDIVPTSPYFDPHSARQPLPQSTRTPKGTSTIPTIRVQDHEIDRKSRHGKSAGGYLYDEGNLTVAWKNKKDDRVPSAP